MKWNMTKYVKGTVSVYSSQCEDGYARFTPVTLKALKDLVVNRYRWC